MGKKKLFMKNGGMILEEFIATCNGESNPIRTFSLREVKRGTDRYDFRHIIVWDSHYRLYQGFLQGRQVSIKRFDDSFPGGLEGILRDIAIASSMSAHRNALKLLGCCLEAHHPLVVYEFVGDNVLAKLLNSNAPHEALRWKNRVRIAMDIANAVAFMHTGLQRPVVHRCINASSTLLDWDGVARLFDYSLAIAIPPGGMMLQAGVEGRAGAGVGAPEYLETGYLTEKADVYLFGLFALHLLVGYNVSRARSLGEDGGECVIFPGRGEYKEERRRFVEIVDPRIVSERVVDDGQLLGFWRLALACIANVGEDRPTMVEVAKGMREIYRSVPVPVPFPAPSMIGLGSSNGFGRV